MRRIVYGDSIAKHTSPESAQRQYDIALDNGVELVEDCPAVPRELANYRAVLEDGGKMCFPRQDICLPSGCK